MNPDKKIMWIGLVLFIALIAAFPFIKDFDLDKENAILNEIDALEVAIEKIADVHYTPLSNSERVARLEDYLKTLTVAQNKIAKTTLSQLLIDLNESIDEIQNTISELRLNEDEDSEHEVSFQTQEEHSIFADKEFTTEALFKFASVLDNIFPGAKGNAVFMLNCEYGYVTVVIIPYENPENFEKVDLREFAELLSNEVFNLDSVYIRLDYQDPEDE